MFLKNVWYMAGWSGELGEAGLVREIADRPVYLYRLENGDPAAVVNRCPHRFAPLSMGTREGDVNPRGKELVKPLFAAFDARVAAWPAFRRALARENAARERLNHAA